MTNKLTATFNLNQQLESGSISFADYHLELLKINGDQ